MSAPQWPTYRAAFRHTIPTLTGYIFLGTAYGIYMNRMGFAAWYPPLISLVVYAGSMQFVLVNLLLQTFSPLGTFLLTLMVNARHLFYGLAMLTKYGGSGFRRGYMIFALTDETFSVNVSVEPPAGIDKQSFMLAISLMNQSYWVLGATVGGLVGSLVQFDTRGIDFVMTALFVVIFTEQWLTHKGRIPAIVGVMIPVVSLLIFGADSFIIPAMAGMLAVLIALRNPLTKKEAQSCS